ncbi:hypothetical protein ACIOJD_12710 [Streptomyces sp. NPDC088116]|uniref:hypothetical protein n=1 Tax=Streptomyces sp. NPDC088116 TaxID=3365825 RepID=UPI0037F87663
MEQQEASEDAVMTRIGQAAMLLHGGDREEARNRFGELWTEIGEAGDPLHRCTLAHYMADTQDDPGDELAWDLRALTAADGLTGRAKDNARGEAGDGSGENGQNGQNDWRGESDEGGESDGGEARPVRAVGVSPAVRSFYPSLHLNLAADYMKLERPEAARLHLDRARDAADALGDDGYGDGVRAGIDRLERRLRER